jgi:hypothetical protein
MNLWKVVQRALDAEENQDSVQDAIGIAAFLFEKTAEIGVGRIVTDEYAHSRAWPDEVILTPVDLTEAAALIESLKRFCLRGRDHGSLMSAFWALGKAPSVDLIPFLRDQLAIYVGSDAQLAYQILIALGNCGEKVFRNGGSSSLDEAENLECARIYLARWGIGRPARTG